MFGVMIDCSRNAVMSPESLKAFIGMIARMGFDTLMLYTEDTYEVKNQPCFGHLRGRYSTEELKEADAYCRANGIELVPCIQTLAHLNGMFRWESVYGGVKDCDDILLAGEEKTYELIRDMFASLAESFTSRRVHIGMDEAYMVGLGRYRSIHGVEERFDIINRHLHRVCDIAEEFGFRPMIWSDMFCKLALNQDNYYAKADPEEIRKAANLPENVSLVYWDYYGRDEKRYEDQIRLNQAFDREVIFAGGAWTWRGFLPDNDVAFSVTEPALEACRACGVDSVFITLWGDDGGECSRFAAIPALLEAAKAAGRLSEETAEKLFPKEKRDAFLLCEKLNHPCGARDLGGQSTSKFLLYNDPFTGLMNHAVPKGADAFYRTVLKELRAAGRELFGETETAPEPAGSASGMEEDLCGAAELKTFWEAAEALCAVLSIKSELSVRTKQAFRAGDRDAMREIAERDYPEALRLLKAFHKAYQTWWMTENKPYGFDVQDIRLGGLMQRLESCRERLCAWCAGTLSEIPELAEEDLDTDGGTFWYRIASPNVLSHMLP